MALTVNITKQLGGFQLNAEFKTGHEIMGLLGASGCGKSVTLKCIAGILTPDKGYIELDGRVLFDSSRKINLSPQKRRVGYLFQNYALFPNMTVRQNIAAGLRDCKRSLRKTKTEELLRVFYLEELASQYPYQLSGGQQQRTALARILASEPEALLLDEPFSALDSYLKWQVEFELMEFMKLFKGPALFVTHNQNEALHFCSSVCILDNGRTQPKTDIETVFTAPATLAACILSGCENISRARPAGDTLIDCLDWGITLDYGKTVPRNITHLGIRAEALKPASAGQLNTFPCQIIRVINNISSMTAVLSAPGRRNGFSCLRMEVDKHYGAALDMGMLFIRFAPENLLCISSYQE